MDKEIINRSLPQGAADIKNIILVGGGAFFYRKALKTAFPHH